MSYCFNNCKFVNCSGVSVHSLCPVSQQSICCSTRPGSWCMQPPLFKYIVLIIEFVLTIQYEWSWPNYVHWICDHLILNNHCVFDLYHRMFEIRITACLKLVSNCCLEQKTDSMHLSKRFEGKLNWLDRTWSGPVQPAASYMYLFGKTKTSKLW